MKQMDEHYSVESVRADINRLVNLASSLPEFIYSKHRFLLESLIIPEYKHITGEKVSGLSKSTKNKVKSLQDKVRHLIDSQEWNILNVGFFGETNAGKSTIIEAISCGDGSSIGDGRKDYTRDIVIREVNIDGFKLRLIDMPGIEGKEVEVQDKIKSAVNACHIVFFTSGTGREVERGTLEKLKSYLNERALVFCLLNRRSNIQMLTHTKELLNKDIVKVVNRVNEQMKSVFGKHYGGEVIVADALLAFLGRGRFSKPLFGFLGRRSKYTEYREKVLQIFKEEGELIEASGINNLLKRLSEACITQRYYIFKYNLSKVLKEIKDHLLDTQKEIERFAEGLYLDKRVYRVLEDSKIEFKNVRNRIKVNIDEILSGVRAEMVDYGCSKIDAGDNEFSIDVKKYVEPKLNKIAKIVKAEVESFTKSLEKKLDGLKISNPEKISSLPISTQSIRFEADDWDAFWDLLKGGAFAALAVGRFFGPIGMIIAFASGGLLNLFMSEEERIMKRKKELTNKIDSIITALRDSIMSTVDSILNKMETKLDTITKLAEEDPKKIENYVNDLRAKLKEVMNTVDSYSSHIEDLMGGKP